MTSLSNDMKAIKARMNLSVLQRLDATISSIELTFDHVVLYEFVPKKREWKKKGVEGSGFVVKRSDGSFCLVILNRLAVENFVLLLDEKIEIEYQSPYVLLKSNNNEKQLINKKQQQQQQSQQQQQQQQSQQQKIYGIWFYREQYSSQFLQFCENQVLKQQSASTTTNNNTNAATSMAFNNNTAVTGHAQPGQIRFVDSNGSSILSQLLASATPITSGALPTSSISSNNPQMTMHQYHSTDHYMAPHSTVSAMGMNGATGTSSSTVPGGANLLEEFSKRLGFTLNYSDDQQQQTQIAQQKQQQQPTINTYPSTTAVKHNAETSNITTASTSKFDPMKTLVTPEFLIRDLELRKASIARQQQQQQQRTL